MSEQEIGGAAEARDEESAAAEAVTDDGEAPPATPGESEEARALRERHLRLAAEFDNYRKRVERERGESWARAQAQLLERLLEPLDDLQRIAGQDLESATAGTLHEGAAMVEKKFARVLEAIGVEAIDAEGKPFDPTIHEALTTVPTESAEEDNTVAQVYQKGYLLKGILLRPARVVVKKHQG
jgi:molecular chaperone GrpE